MRSIVVQFSSALKKIQTFPGDRQRGYGRGNANDSWQRLWLVNEPYWASHDGWKPAGHWRARAAEWRFSGGLSSWRDPDFRVPA